jgi:hypothetical protein
MKMMDAAAIQMKPLIVLLGKEEDREHQTDSNCKRKGQSMAISKILMDKLFPQIELTIRNK